MSTRHETNRRELLSIEKWQWVKAYLLPLLLVLLTWALRLYNLEGKSLWHDELGTLNYVRWDKGWLDTLRQPLIFPTIPIPPLFFLITRLFTALGYNEFVLRLPSALIATATIPLTYSLGKSLLDRRAALLAAFFLAISCLHIRYAQEARSYATLTFFAILSLYLFWRALGSKEGRWWVAFVAATTCLLYTHVFGLLSWGVMTLFAAGLWLVRKEGGRLCFRRLHFVVATLAILFLFVPMVPHVLDGLLSERGLGEASGLVSGGLGWDLDSLFSALRLYGGESDAGAVIYALVFGLGMVVLALKRRDILVLAAMWLFLPVVIVLSMPFGHRVLIRYFLSALPMYLLVAAYGFVEATRWLACQADFVHRRRGWRLALSLLAGIFLLVMFLENTLLALASYQAESKQNWRDATRLFLSIAQRGDQVYVTDERQQAGVALYAEQLASNLNGSNQFSIGVLPEDPVQDLTLDKSSHGWLVVPFPSAYVPNGALDVRLKAHRFWPPLVLSSANVPKDSEYIAPYSYNNMALIRFEPDSSSGKLCQPDDKLEFQAWLDTGRELGIALDDTLSLGLFAYYCGDPAEAIELLSTSSGLVGHELFLYSVLAGAHQGLEQWDEAMSYYRLAMNLDPTNIGWEVRIGNIYRESGEFEKAENSYLRVLEQAEQWDWPRRELAQLYEEMGQFEAALQEYQRLSELSPWNAYYLAKVGQVYNQLGLLEQARDSYQRAVELEPESGWYHALLANTWLALEEGNRAVEEYNQALVLEPDYTQELWYHRGLGNAYRLLAETDSAGTAEGYLKSAAAAYQRAAQLESEEADLFFQLCRIYHQLAEGHETEALAACQQAVDLDSSKAWYRVLLGDAYVKNGHFDQALAEYGEALRLEPSYEDRTWYHRRLGDAYRQIAETDNAVTAYEQALALAPASVTVWQTLGDTLFDEGHLKEAAAAYERAVGLEPDEAVLSFQLCRTYHQLAEGHEREALVACQQAVDLDESKAWYRVLLGDAYAKNGHFDQALTEYGEALRLETSYEDKTWYHRRVGDVYQLLAETDSAGAAEESLEEAAAAYQRAVQLEPEDAELFFQLCRIYHQLAEGHATEALAVCQQAVTLDSSRAWYRVLLGDAYVKNGQFDQALAEYGEAAHLEPSYQDKTWYHLRLGNAYRLAGMTASAVAAYERVLHLDEDSAEARKWLKELRP